MTPELLLQHIEALRGRLRGFISPDSSASFGDAAKAQTCEFLKTYAGARSAFLARAEAAEGYDAYLVDSLDSILISFGQYVAAGLASGLSPERRAQLDVVSDILSQAQALLDESEFHPASAAMLIGASLEEFLRTWVESVPLSIGSAKPGIDAYAKALRAADLVSKQDVKDITSWAGIRNHAAHGEWEQVKERDRVRLMLEGVNLFMRQRAVQ